GYGRHRRTWRSLPPAGQAAPCRRGGRRRSGYSCGVSCVVVVLRALCRKGPQRGGDIAGGLDAHALAAAGFTLLDDYLLPCDAAQFCQKGHQFGIGRAVHRRRADADFQRAVVLADDLRAAGARLQITAQQQVIAVARQDGHQMANRIIRNWMPSSTISGLRSSPPIDGRMRRTGAITGSVIWIMMAVKGLYGSGATQLRMTRISTAKNR